MHGRHLCLRRSSRIHQLQKIGSDCCKLSKHSFIFEKMRKSFLNYNYAFAIVLNSYFKKRWYPVHARKWTHFRLPWHNSPCTNASLWLFFLFPYFIYFLLLFFAADYQKCLTISFYFKPGSCCLAHRVFFLKFILYVKSHYTCNVYHCPKCWFWKSGLPTSKQFIWSRIYEKKK